MVLLMTPSFASCELKTPIHLDDLHVEISREDFAETMTVPDVGALGFSLLYVQNINEERNPLERKVLGARLTLPGNELFGFLDGYTGMNIVRELTSANGEEIHRMKLLEKQIDGSDFLTMMSEIRLRDQQILSVQIQRLDQHLRMKSVCITEAR